MLVGVVADKVAEPPERAKTKSEPSKAPLPPLVLYTASDMVTAMVPLSAARETPVMVGRPSSFKVAVLLLWLIDETFPLASKTAASARVIMSVSLPFGVPLRPMPKVYTLPEAEMLVGVVADKVAEPPERAKTKSEPSKAPLPPLVLYTASDMVTAMVPLSAASETPAMVAATLSFKVAVLLLWVVDETFPLAS